MPTAGIAAAAAAAGAAAAQTQLRSHTLTHHRQGREGRGDLRRQERIKETEGGESQRARERKLKGGIRPRAGGGERVGGTDGKRETMEGEKVTALWI